MEKYSVLMSVYYKEDPGFLGTAMDSMFNQTLPPDEFVLVCDGPLTEELDAVIREREEAFPDVLRTIRLAENGGLGNALKTGLKECRNSLVARMDSDDISRQDRCEKQLKYFEEHPDISILGGAIAEFQTDPSVTYATRAVPQEHEEIVAFSKSRNPFNHMTVMYRKEHILAAGNYQHFPFLEDYFLWVRLFIKGYRGHNLPDVLVDARVGNGMINRRSGLQYAKTQKNLFAYMLKKGYISRAQYLKAVTGRTVMAIAPAFLKELVYGKILRK